MPEKEVIEVKSKKHAEEKLRSQRRHTLKFLRAVEYPDTTKEISDKLGMDYFDVFLHLLALEELKLVSLTDGRMWRLTEAGEKELRKLEAEERLAELPKV